MRDMIGYCGLDCEKCDAYIATVIDDQTLREKTAKLWAELNNAPILPEHINCVGCRVDGVKTVFCEHMCEIRKCALSKGFSACGDCSEVEIQTQRIIDSLQQYIYRRTPGTLFSDGSLSDLGEWLICIYIYRDNELVNTVIVSDTGDISVNDRCYSMQDSPALIQEITEIL